MLKEKGIFGLQIESRAEVTEKSVMKVMDELFERQPTQGLNNMINALSGVTGAFPMSRIDGAAIVLSPRFAAVMKQRGYRKRYEQEVLDNGETRQYCVGFEKTKE